MKNEIHLNGLQSGANTLIIREGQALPELPKNKLVIKGDISSVTAFIAGRYGEKKGKELQEIDRDLAVIIVDEDKMFVKLMVDPNNPVGTEVTGQLEHTPELQQFLINTGNQFTREQIVKMLRFNKRFFPNVEQHEKMLESFMTFQVKTETELKAANDTRGNKSSSLDKKVNSYGLPTDFILSLPIFKGKEIERFRVEVGIETTDGSVRFWFESTELVELIERRKKEIFSEITSPLSDFVIVRI